MLKWNSLKRLMVVFAVAVFAAACGDKSIQGELDIQKLDLSKDTVAITVPLGSFEDNTIGSGYAQKLNIQLPVSYDQLKTIRVIMIDSDGRRHLVGKSAMEDTVKDSDTGASYTRKWIQDAPEQWIANVVFFQDSLGNIEVNLFNRSKQKNDGVIDGSETIANILKPGMDNIRLYFHFEKI